MKTRNINKDGQPASKQTKLDRFAISSLASKATLLWNLIYALFNGIMGAYYRSFWFISMAAWNLIIGALRAFLLFTSKSVRDQKKTAGKGICMLAIVLSGIVCMGIAEQQNPVKETVVMIALATYTFTTLIYAAISALKAHRRKEDRAVIERDLSLVISIGSLLSLERGMLGTFGDASDNFTFLMEAVSGAAAFLMIIAIGISLMVGRQISQDKTDISSEKESN